ncbi:MAG: nucleotidyltransferase domain-containing protein [Chloroflexi bacterium]|nr:nucleotidyltransferase domain-containing protein [Chloroflexota bacterium]
MLEPVNMTVQTLTHKLGDQIEAIYLFGSLAEGHFVTGESDINLFVVVRDGTQIRAVRNAFQPAWQSFGDLLKRAPFLASRTAFNRHLRLNPLFAQHMVKNSQQLVGTPDFLDRKLATVDPHEAYAYLITEAMQVSTLLTSTLLDEKTIAANHKRLQRLARKLRNEPLPAGEPAVRSFARIQHFLNPIMGTLPATTKWFNTVPIQGTTPLLPGLQSLYDETGQTILVFNRLTPHQFATTDWAKLASRQPKNIKGLQVTTVEQMGLSIMFDRPLDLRFKKIRHTWGPDFIAAFSPRNRQIMRYSARVPSRILIDELPNAYLTNSDSDEALQKIIHDFQNKMMNIGLEHELLVRFGLSDRFTPPTPTPDRKTSLQKRVNALFQHLEWWADFYDGRL